MDKWVRHLAYCSIIQALVKVYRVEEALALANRQKPHFDLHQRAVVSLRRALLELGKLEQAQDIGAGLLKEPYIGWA